MLAKTSEKCITVDEETASFLAKANKLQEFKEDQFDNHQVLIDTELTNPCNIWIVCEKSKMNNAEEELTSLTDAKKIASSTFRPIDPMKVRFLKEHCWGKIKEKERSCRAEGVLVTAGDNNSLEVKGTQEGRKEMITFLQNLAEKVNFKVRLSFLKEKHGELIEGYSPLVCSRSPLTVPVYYFYYIKKEKKTPKNQNHRCQYQPDYHHFLSNLVVNVVV